MDLMDRRRMMIAKKALPYDAEIEYLESSGTQWIDTGIKPASTLPFTCQFDNTNINYGGPGYGNVFGSRISSNNNEYQLSMFSSGTISIGNRISNFGFNTLGVHTISFNGENIVTVDGITTTIAKGTITNNIGNIVLFGISQGSTTSATQLQAGKIYSCSFGTLRNFIPVRVGLVGYMYDTVSGTLFGNAGTGDFILGPDIN